MSDANKRTEFGWVVEGAWSDPAAPEYWCGSSLWSSNHMQALRFAREHDAMQAADSMCAGMNVRIREHGWDGENIRESVSPGIIRNAVSEPAPDR